MRTLVRRPDSPRLFVGGWEQAVRRGSGRCKYWDVGPTGRLRGSTLNLKDLPDGFGDLQPGQCWPGTTLLDAWGRSDYRPARFTAVAFSADGRRFAAAEQSYGLCLFLFDAETGKALAIRREGETMRALAAVLRGGEEWLAVAVDGEVRLCDAVTLHERGVLRGHGDWVLTLAACPDGRSVLSGSRDGTVRQWDVATGREMAGWNWDVGAVWSVAVAPDGLTAAAGGQSGRVVVWDLDG